MKSIIALVAVLALTGTVEAAPTKTKATRSAKASKGTRVAAVNSKASVEKASSRSNVDMKQTATLAEVAPAVTPKKWGLSLISDSYTGIEGRNTGTADIASDHSLRTSYKITDTISATAAFEFGQMWGAGDEANEASTTMYDPFLRLSKSDLADLGNGVGVSGQVRLYLPASELSQDKEQLAQVRVYLTAERAISKALTASFTLSPRFFAQQNDTYIDAKGKPQNLDTMRLLSYAGVKYAFNDLLAIEQTFGTYQMWKTNTDRADYLDVSSSVYYTPASWIELNLGIRQSYGATDARNSGLRGIYSQDQAEYFLVTSLSI